MAKGSREKEVARFSTLVTRDLASIWCRALSNKQLVLPTKAPPSGRFIGTKSSLI